MKTPNLWQKLLGGFKRPNKTKTETVPKKTLTETLQERGFGRGFRGGKSVFYKKKGHDKKRKRKKHIENRSRAVNYQNAKR